MKKILYLLMIFLVTATSNSLAQSYSVNKKKYDSSQYVHQPDDPYHPVLSGVCSFFVPGLGQMINGEMGRGLRFLGGSAGFAVITGTGALLMLSSVFEGMAGNDTGSIPSLGAILVIGGITGMIAVDVWSIIDAIKVAKIGNMHFQNQQKTKISMVLKPYLGSIAMGEKLTTPAGLALQVSF
jgi:hypothetical protein